MKLMGSDDILTNPMRYMDLGHGLLLNGHYYSHDNYRPQPLRCINKSMGMFSCQSKFNLYNYTAGTLGPNVAGASSMGQNAVLKYSTENMIQDNLDPNIYYMLRDSHAATANTATGVVSKKVGSNVEIIDTEIGIGGYNKNFNTYMLKQTDTHIFWVVTNGYTAGTNKSGEYGYRIMKYEKATKIQTALTLPLYHGVAGAASASSSYPCHMWSPVSILWDTDLFTVYSVCFDYYNTANTGASIANMYQNFYRLDKSNQTISEIARPVPTNATWGNFVATSGYSVTQNNKWHHLSFASYGVDRNGKKYCFTIHTQDYTTNTYPKDLFMVVLDQNESGPFIEEIVKIAIDWDSSSYTEIPKQWAYWYHSDTYGTTATTMSINNIIHPFYNVFVTETTDGQHYINIGVMDNVSNDRNGIYTFKMDFDTNIAKFASKTSFVNNIFFDYLLLDNSRHNGKNTKFLMDNTSGYYIYQFNQDQGKWESVFSKPLICTSHSVDERGNLIHTAGLNTGTGDILIDSLQGNVNIEWSFERTSYTYIGTPIVSHIKAKAFNYLHEQVEQDIEFTITGPAKWQANGNATIVVKTKTNEDITLPFVTTANAGNIGVYAKPITGFGG